LSTLLGADWGVTRISVEPCDWSMEKPFQATLSLPVVPFRSQSW
jgi:hypothetical protein